MIEETVYVKTQNNFYWCRFLGCTLIGEGLACFTKQHHNSLNVKLIAQYHISTFCTIPETLYQDWPFKVGIDGALDILINAGVRRTYVTVSRLGLILYLSYHLMRIACAIRFDPISKYLLTNWCRLQQSFCRGSSYATSQGQGTAFKACFVNPIFTLWTDEDEMNIISVARMLTTRLYISGRGFEYHLLCKYLDSLSITSRYCPSLIITGCLNTPSCCKHNLECIAKWH